MIPPEDAQPTVDPLLGAVVAGRYRVTEVLGRGGMGAVYKAVQVELDRPVAIKVLHPDLVRSARESERFRREALATARLRHPNIVTVFDFGLLEGGQAYIVMEHLGGPTLERWLAQHGRCEPAEAVDLLRPICLAIDASHRAGIVHRDLKPANIVLPTPDNPDDTVRVVDFGIARLREEVEGVDLTGTTMIGTPAYMAPEQVDGSAAEPRSDIYSIGVIAYELLTGQRPFRAPSGRAVIVQHLTETPRPPSELVPGLSTDIDTVILKSLEKLPERRHATARDFIDALSACCVTSQAEPVRESLTETDETTGLLNRRTFYTKLSQAKVHSDASGSSFGLVLFDVDGLKAINDRCGYTAGDNALRAIAAIVRSVARVDDIVCRYAGDEFAVILRGAGQEICSRVISTVQAKVRAATALQELGGVTVSAGSTIYDGGGNPPEMIVATADRALAIAGRHATEGRKFLPLSAADTPTAVRPSEDTATIVHIHDSGTTSVEVPKPRALEFDVFVGRERELRALADAASRAAAGQLSASLVVGDAGIGKSRLIAAFIAEQRNTTVLSTRFLEGAVGPPYRALLAPLAAWFGGEVPATSVASTPAEARVIDAILRGDAGDIAESLRLGGGGADKLRAFEAIRRVYLRIARAAPVLVVVEDLQWADPLSLEFISYLISSTAEGRILLAATARTEALQEHGLLRLWARSLARTERLERVELTPFREQDVRALIQEICGRFDRRVEIAESLISRLTRETDGNPLHIVEVIRAWATDGTFSYNARAGVWCVGKVSEIVLPKSVAELFEARVSAIDDRMRDALRMAAAIGEEFRLDLLMDALGWDEDDLVDVLDDAVRTGFIEELSNRREEAFRFANATVRRLLLETTTGTRRRRLHARVAELLEKRREAGGNVTPGELALQFAAARNYERAVAYALDAAQAAWVGQSLDATEDMLTIGEQALEAGVPVSPLDAARLRVLRGETEALRKRFASAIAQFHAGLDEMERAGIDDPLLHVRALRNIGVLTAEGGEETDAALARLLEALRYAETHGLIAEAGRLRIAIGFSSSLIGEFEAALGWVESGLNLARRHGERNGVAHGLIARGGCLARLGRNAEALQAGTEALGLARELRDRRLEMEALNLIGKVYHERGNHSLAYDYFAQVTDLARSIGDIAGELRGLMNIGETHRLLGQYDDAIACFEKIEGLVPEHLSHQREGVVVNMALAYCGMGRPAYARPYLDKARHLNALTNDLFCEGYIWYTEAEILLLEGNYEAAGQAAARSLVLGRKVGSPEVEWHALWAAARAHEQLGDKSACASALAECLAVLERMASHFVAEEDRARFFADKQDILDAAADIP